MSATVSCFTVAPSQDALTQSGYSVLRALFFCRPLGWVEKSGPLATKRSLKTLKNGGDLGSVPGECDAMMV